MKQALVAREWTKTQKRLWKAGAALALVLVTIVIANPILSPPGNSVTGNMMGLDFTAFYTGGTFVRDGRYRELYDINQIYVSEQNLGRECGLDMKPSVGPFWNPPFYAWVFVPLSKLPFPVARNLWVGFNALCILISVWLMTKWLPAGSSWKTWGLVPLLVLASMPVLQALTHGQNTGTSLLILCTTVTLWRKAASEEEPAGMLSPALWAGIVAGLLFYKPQLAAVVAAALVLTLGRRALLGLVMTGLALLLITDITLPGSLSDFAGKLPGIMHYMQIEHPYLWNRHATIRAFWRLLIQGKEAGETIKIVSGLSLVCALALGAGLLGAILKQWKEGWPISPAALDRIIAATVATTPLIMPFYFDYDLLLVSAAAVLFAVDRLRGGAGKVWPWAALYGVLLINPGLGANTRVNLAVPLLMIVSGMLILRAWRGEVGEKIDARQSTEPLRQAA